MHNPHHSKLVSRDLNVLWHPCSQMRDYADFPPMEILSAEGVWLERADGRRLIDAISSWWCRSLGHRHPRIVKALVEQAADFEHVILANTTNEGVVRLCERLVNALNGLGAEYWGSCFTGGKRPGHFSKVFLADNGSTAIEIAMKMALQAQSQLGRPGRTRFASLRNGYHGETAGVMSVSDLGLYKAHYSPMTFTCEMLSPIPYRSGGNDPAWNDASDVWPKIEETLNRAAETLAAIIYEPVLQGAGGMRLYSPDLIRRLRRWADRRNVFLIADEIAAGMGRLGRFLAGDAAGDDIKPDFAVVSKGLTAGALPLSAVVTTDLVYDAFYADYSDGKAFLHSNTWTGNALAVAVANVVFEVYDSEKIFEHVASCEPLLADGVKRLSERNLSVRNPRGMGMMAAVDLCRPDGTPLDPRSRTGYAVFREAVSRGALLRPLGDTMYLFPPLNTPPEIIAELLNILEDSIMAVMG